MKQKLLTMLGVLGLSVGLAMVWVSPPIKRAWAGVSCAVPFTFINGQTADATQVNSNYNALVACLANAASAGNNSDITTLSGLTTPLAPGEGGASTYFGGTSTGAANAQVVSVTPTNFTLTLGYRVSFTAGFTNSGPTQVNVSGTGLVNVFRRTQLGVSAMVGGEIIAGHRELLEYDGSEFQQVNREVIYVGEQMDWSTAIAPPGTLFEDGSCAVRATFPDLFTVLGTAYDPTGSTCDGSHFALPDMRGRSPFYADNQGVNGAANRLTSAGSGCAGTTIGSAGCGVQAKVIANANLPASIPYSDPGHSHTITWPSSTYVTSDLHTFGFTNAASNQSSATLPTSTNSSGVGIVINQGGANTALPIIPPTQVITKVIRY